MSKVKTMAIEASEEAKPQGYVLTEKGLKAARKTGKWINSMDDILLRVMMKSPDAPLTKGTLSDDLWQRASMVLVKLEEEGLVEETEVDVNVSKPQVAIGDAGKPSKLKLEVQAKPGLQKLTKDVYSDRKGERLTRKRRKGWKKVKY